jgi:hypothetical protein
VAIYSLGDIDDERIAYGYFPLFHILLVGINGAFLTGDLFNLYVWFEIILISSFVMIALGSERAQLEGAIKYLTLNLFASILFLTAVGMLYGVMGALNLADLAVLVSSYEDQGIITVIAILFIIAFGIKAAIFPLFFWLPASYHTPPVAVSALIRVNPRLNFKLTAEAKKAIRHPHHAVFISAVTAVEISIKKSLGKLDAPENLEEEIESRGLQHLPLNFRHGATLNTLPHHHQDPFDRMRRGEWDAIAREQQPGEEAGACRCLATARLPGIVDQRCLDPVPRFLVDDRRVLAFIDLALVADLAEIERVGEHRIAAAWMRASLMSVLLQAGTRAARGSAGAAPPTGCRATRRATRRDRMTREDRRCSRRARRPGIRQPGD